MKNIVLALFVITFTGVTAQNVEFNKKYFPNNKKELQLAKKNVFRGTFFFNEGKVKQALKLFLEANDFNPDNADLNMKIGESYLCTSPKNASLPYLEKAVKLKATNPYVYYLYAQALQLNMKWDEAIVSYKKYNNNLDKNRRVSVELVNKRIKECKTGKQLVESPIKVRLDNLGENINSKYADYCPLISADESVMIYTSRRPSTLNKKKDPVIDDYFEDLFVTEKKDRLWTKSKNMGTPVNTAKHDATVGLSVDGQRLFIYKDDGEDNGNGNIYECILEGDKWSSPVRLSDNINSDFQEPSASLSSDSKLLYFVSDRPGGLGGKDIYVSKANKKGEWGAARNLGKEINTPYEEDAVFIHPDGKTLYFSSTGHNNMGGYDIFKSVLNGRKWSKPQNIGYPINTPDNDAFFVISASGQHGYYSSFQKDGLGEKDIYMITFLKDSTLPDVEEPKLTILSGVVSDNNSAQPLQATIEIVDNSNNEVISLMKSNAHTGKYLISLPSGRNFGISVSVKGYLFHSENFDVRASLGYQKIEKNIGLNKIETGKNIVLNNIFFEYGKATLQTSSTSELNRIVNLLNEIPTLKIEISGHTDNQGSAGYNKKLSEQRAKSVIDFLITKGIVKSRLTYVGYGFDKPIASNETESGRLRNRRTEFKIISN